MGNVAFRNHAAFSETKSLPCSRPHPHTLPPSSLEHPDTALLPTPPTREALFAPDSIPGVEGPHPWSGGAPSAPLSSPSLDNPSLSNGRRRPPLATHRRQHPRASPHHPCPGASAKPSAHRHPAWRVPSCAQSSATRPCSLRTCGIAVRPAPAHRSEKAQEEQPRQQRRRLPEPPQVGQGAHGAGGSAAVLGHRRRWPKFLRTLAGGSAPAAWPGGGTRDKRQSGRGPAACPPP